MEAIGTVGKITISNDGMIAKVNLDNSNRSNLILCLLKLEDRQFNLEFKILDIERIRQDIQKMGYENIDLALSRAQKKLHKEVKVIKRLQKNLVSKNTVII